MVRWRRTREDQPAFRIADAAGPLRVAAAGILKWEIRPPLAPREALNRLAGGWDDPSAR